MAIVYPLVESKSYEGACYGNFLSKRVRHCVRPLDPEVAFEDTRSPVPSVSLKTRVVGRDSLVNIHRIPGSVFGDDSLDALLVRSRLYQGISPGDSLAEDILSIHVFDPAEHRMKRIRRCTVTCPGRGRMADLSFSPIAICNIQGIHYGSVLFCNGTDNTVFKFNHTGDVETVSLSLKSNKFPKNPCHPTDLIWVTSNLAAVVHESHWTHVMEFIEFGANRKENLKLYWSEEFVKFVGAGPTPGTVIVLFLAVLRIYKLTENDVQIVKEFALDHPHRSHSWYPLDVSDSSGNFYISEKQDVLLVREEHEPTLLKVHDRIPGRLTSLGFGMFAIVTDSNVLHFCQFRLNRDSTSVVVEMLGSRETPSGDRTLIARTKDSNFGQRFWWKQPRSGTMIVTQGTIDVRRDVCLSDYNGNVSDIWATSTTADQQCYILSTDGKSVLASLENRELRAIETPSWQVLDEETVLANTEVQVTRTRVVWRNGTAVTFDDRINVVSCQDPLLALATNECAYVYFKGEEVKTINVENTIINISCNAVGVVAVLAFDKLIVYNHSTKSMEKRAFDVFCTAVIVTDSGAVRVGTGRGELLGDTDLKISRFPIRKIFTCGSDLIVTDTSANAYLVSKKGEMTRLSLGITHPLLPLTGDDHLTVFEGLVQVVRFSTSAPRCYENSTVSAFPGAPDSIDYSCGSFYALYWAKREVHVATPQDFPNTAVHRFAEVESMTEEAHHQFFLLDSSRILEVIDNHPGYSEDEYIDDVRVIVRLHKVEPQLNRCLLLHEQVVSFRCDSCDGPTVYIARSLQMFCIDAEYVDGVYGTIVSDQVILRRWDSVSLKLDFRGDLMLDETSQEVISVDYDGHVRSTPIENWYLSPRDFDGELELPSVHNLGSLFDSEEEFCWGASPLSRKQVYAATINRYCAKKPTRVVVFSVDGVVSILANFAIPGSNITLLRSDDVSLDQNGDLTPDFYVGTHDGALYSVSLPQDAQLVKSLGRIQLSLRQDMGFDENLEGYLNGSLLQAAAQRQEYKHLFEENGVSAESFSAGLLKLIG